MRDLGTNVVIRWEIGSMWMHYIKENNCFERERKIWVKKALMFIQIWKSLQIIDDKQSVFQSTKDMLITNIEK